MYSYENDPEFQKALTNSTADTELDYYLSHAYHNMRFFYKAITHYQATSFTFFGDMQRNLFYISDNMRDTFGFSHNLVPNLLEKWKDIVHGERCKALFEQSIASIMADKLEVHDLRYQVADKNGEVFWIRCCGSLLWDEDMTEPIFFAGRVTRQDQTFTVDPVTNFPSTDTLQRNLKMLAGSRLSWRVIGFRFNSIPQMNTLYGRNVADRMIRNICERLMDELGGSLSFYRLPGVRCAAIVEQACLEPTDQIIASIQKIINEGYEALDLPVTGPCSFALVHFPQPNITPDNFLESMVSLVKIAHHEPNQPYVEDTVQNLQRIYDFSTMELAIAQNIQRNMANFRAVIQPIVSAKTGKITAGETLMRWKYQEKDISPAVFIPMLEKNRTIFTAGKWILEQAAAACSRIIRYLPDFYLSVNLSLQQLYDEELLSFIPAILEKYSLDGRHLVLEITESCIDMEPGKLNTLMNMCHRAGVRIALDDFGTGYSSLRVLLQYPTNIIKLDRSLLLEMVESADKSNFINSIVFACHQFGKSVCMEGVENESQKVLTQDAQVDMIQGFYFYRPMEIEDVFRIVEDESRK